MNSTRSPILRRLNGRPQACDPCRVRKVACDHGQPICNRCRKRGQQAECVYIVTDPKPTLIRRSRRPSTPVQHPHHPNTTPTPPTAPGSGYLGFTSHSALFEETRTTLGLLNGPETSSPLAGLSYGSALASFDAMPRPLREMCFFVLKNLCLPDDVELPPRLSSCASEQWIHYAVAQILRSVKEHFGKYLGPNGDLGKMARIVSENTLRPLQDNHQDAHQWVEQITGPRLRWESIGLLWTMWELGVGIVGAPKQLKKKMPSNLIISTCLHYCIEISRKLTRGNDVLVFLCNRRATGESLLAGDASLACWLAHGETVSLLTYLGLHADTKTSPYKPSLCSEHKRRLFANVFLLDKALVSFTGRPPLITRRYSSTPLPLDLKDSDLLGDDEALRRAVSELDENGWNTTGEVYPSTLTRAHVMIAFIRDEILEIALSANAQVNMEQLLDLKTREQQTMASFPTAIIYNPKDLDDLEVDADMLSSKTIIQLDNLQNLFFIERLMLQAGSHDRTDLLIISFELVTLTLTFWTHKELFVGTLRDFEWLLMAYAALGGGILCQELMKPTFQGWHPKNSKLSRSSIIQQLSLLVGCFEWVRPTAPNADMCADCKVIIQKVLDHTLNTSVEGGGAFDTLDWNFPTQLDFNFDLLDSFDWLRPE